MEATIRFMKGFWGRAARVVLGLALIAFGLAYLGGVAGVIVAVVGLFPIGLALTGQCVLEAAWRGTGHAPHAPGHPA